jgi:hypothetical protein
MITYSDAVTVRHSSVSFKGIAIVLPHCRGEAVSVKPIGLTPASDVADSSRRELAEGDEVGETEVA